MACILRELLLDSEEIEDFLKKIFSHMKEVEPQDLPSLVYQLVVLASRGHKRAIINGIMSFSKLQTSQLQEPAQNGSNSGKLQYHAGANFTSMNLICKVACGAEDEV